MPTSRPGATPPGSLFSAVLLIGALHDIEVAQRHKPISWWRERFGEDWVAASTKARRDLDEAIRETVAEAKRSGSPRGTSPRLEDVVAALVVAKCARWTMGTCLTRDVPEAEWCSVCDVLNRLGYEPVQQPGTTVETWVRDAGVRDAS